MLKFTIEQLHDLITLYADQTVDNMDMRDMMTCINEEIQERMINMDNEDVLEEIKEVLPELLENFIKDNEIQEDEVQSSKEYAKGGGTGCPVCKSKNIDTSPTQFDSSGAWQDCTCNECASQWTDEYKLTGYGNLNRKEEVK